ncbi:MAG TPA: methionyl-tRNA formyltransferase [Bryobacteraceae bacterium]|jgi:methionyl-tRNA formyltransferase|nr:methionyl-tRNA formyltransferase [Bryobacteraceae bacterium]
MRTVFLGTPEFAVPTLQALVAAGHEIVGVFTQPDRPKGRGNTLAQSPVKLAAIENAIPVFQPERIRRPENVERLRDSNAEIFVIVGYGQIIPQSVIDIPKHGILNVHASLLPKYRGAAPIQWAIANGESRTGITIMQIDAGLDTGDMLLKAETDIQPEETAPQLSARLAPMGATLLIEAIAGIEQGKIRREKQNDAEATLAPILKKEDGLIDWTRPAQVTFNRLRGFTPWPGAYITFRGEQLSILAARVQPPKEKQASEPGIVRCERRKLFVSCGDGQLFEILELQLAGKKRVSAEAFLNGYKVADGERLGEVS